MHNSVYADALRVERAKRVLQLAAIDAELDRLGEEAPGRVEFETAVLPTPENTARIPGRPKKRVPDA